MWDKQEVVHSSDQNVKKIVFTQEGSNGAVAEAVLYKYPTYMDRTVVCCSTQSGCPVGCRFCGTGNFFIRNLTADEIFSQVKACILLAESEESICAKDIDKLQIMFMSMGEPMLNWKELKTAIRRLNVEYPTADLLISTMAPNSTHHNWLELCELSQEISQVGLQFSIHEAVQEARDKLIPMTAKLSLSEISQWGSYWAGSTGRRPFFNYCVHDKNNTMEDVTALREHFPAGIWECTLSVICEADEGVSAANQRQRKLVEDFMDKMLEAGYSVRMFDPAGQDDIGGGCGQLWYVQDWAKNHPDLIKKTHGTGKARVHVPKAA
jgi:23S rRNA (adenine2503-C2)-methyltransferase